MKRLFFPWKTKKKKASRFARLIIIYVSIERYAYEQYTDVHPFLVAYSCHWGEVTVFTMIHLPEPKRVLPNSPQTAEFVTLYHII